MQGRVTTVQHAHSGHPPLRAMRPRLVNAEVGHDLNAAERTLIERHAPCFNDMLNRRPTPLPSRYTPPGPMIRCSRSLGKLITETRYTVQPDRRQR